MKKLPVCVIAAALLGMGALAQRGTPPANGASAPPSLAVSLPNRIADAEESAQKIRLKIMPLGDSITFGSRDPSYGGYRHLLGTLLTNDGYIIKFVGSRQSGNGVIPDPDNEGHPGWTIPQIKNGIDSNGWLEAYQPDIILLHIGTNDIRRGNAASAPGNLSALLDDILARLPQTHVIRAQIIPFRRGPDQDHQYYNAAIPGIVASKGPRLSMVDMQNILSPSDYGDGVHPNAGGYDKMARAWEPAIRAVKAGVPAPPPGTANGPVVRYVSGSTIKLEQLIGDEDKELHQPTLSRTVTRYGIQGTDLGNSFEHEGRAYFLFGDTVGRLGRALDTIATTDASDPERGVRLDFLTVGDQYLTIQPPGISMGAFEVPVSGISLGGQMYMVVSTNHSPDRTTDRSVLTKFTPPAKFQPLRTISQLPAGRFIKMSMHAEPGPMAGLPPGGPFILIWGTGVYRKSDAYLSIVPAAHFETGQGTRYFAGLAAAGAPTWSEKESDAKPIVKNGTIGDLSVTWCKDLGLWLMTYDSRAPAPAGIEFSYSRTPWGPWSEPQIVFNAVRDGALGKFIHNPRAHPDDGLAGPVIGKGQANPGAVRGGDYAPYVVERWTKLQGSELDLYYVLSTWNPYVVVLMKSQLQVDQIRAIEKPTNKNKDNDIDKERAAVAEHPGTPTFRVHPETTFQTMVGFGAGFNSSKYINAIKKPEDRDQAYDLLYGERGVRLNVVRLTISPNAQLLDAGGHRYNWAADDNTQSVWKAIQPVLKRAKPIIYAVPFTPPARWKDSGRLTKGGSLKHEHYQDYAEYLADFLEYYHKVLGVDVDVLSLQNEPGIAAPWLSCVWTAAELRDFLKILAPMVRARGLSTQFMLSEGTAWTGAWERLKPTLEDPDARRFLNIMASHSYGPPEDKARGQFAAASARNGLPVWMSEMSLMIPPQPDDPGMNAAVRIAGYMHRDLVEARASVWIYCFAIFTSKFQGSMGVLSPADGQGPLQGALMVPKRFWTMANYSHFVLPGWKLMQIDGDGPGETLPRGAVRPGADRIRAELDLGFVNTGFVNPEGDSFVIVALNASANPQPATYDFGDGTIGAVEAFSTTTDLNLARVPPPATQPHRFSATLPPMSVTTFVGKLDYDNAHKEKGEQF